VNKFSLPRQLISITLTLSFSCAALGGDGTRPSGAVLHPSGKVQLNGVLSRQITALFPGDLIETTEDSVANITAEGSSVLILQSASVKFMGQDVELSEGGVSVATSAGMTVTADAFTITPADQKQSKFEVVETDDLVAVAAQQGNVSVADGQQTSTVQQGQETTRKKKKKNGGAVPAGGGSHSLSGKTVAIIGAASGATVAGLLIAESNKKKKCVSSSNNKKCKCTKDKHGNEDCEEGRLVPLSPTWDPSAKPSNSGGYFLLFNA
jgi:hypothetical protein